MKIYIANDHTGVKMKNALLEHLTKEGYEVVNLGTDSNDSVNYASYGEKLAKKVVSDEDSLGIAICGTGVGISIAANKVKGAIAGVSYEEATAKIIREHNDANIFATGARIIATEKAIGCVEAFLDAKFAGGRHIERVNYLKNMEGQK